MVFMFVVNVDVRLDLEPKCNLVLLLANIKHEALCFYLEILTSY